MSLLAETLVEEWLNRQGFFTMRGIKDKVQEIDLLAIRPEQDGSVTGWHVESQVSFRPVGYISKLSKEIAVEPGRSRSSARKRTPQELEQCVAAWVDLKFRSATKRKIRSQLWPGIKWSFHFVHAKVKDPAELKCIAGAGVKLVPFMRLLYDLCEQEREGHTGFSGTAGGDFAEIVGYFYEGRLLSEYR